MALQIGATTEVTVTGDRLREGDHEPVIWSSFNSEWEALPDEKPNPRKVRFRVTLPKGAQPGSGAIRAWTPKGTSVPCLLLKDDRPGAITFRFKNNAPFTHEIEARAGQQFVCEIWANRLNQKVDPVLSLRGPDGQLLTLADDDPVSGADPLLRFKATAAGRHTLEVHDLHWAAGPFAVLRVGGRSLRKAQLPNAHHRTRSDPRPIALHLKKGEYLTITPRTHVLGSPAMLLMELKEAGRRLSQSGKGDQLDEPLRYRVTKDAACELYVHDLLGREGLPFALDISRECPPFIVQQLGNDCHNLKPGQELKLKFRVTRFNYNGPVSILCKKLDPPESVVIPGKKNDAQLAFRVPECAKPASLLAFRFNTHAEVEGRAFQGDVLTDEQLKKTPKHLLGWPDGLSGMNFLTVLEGPGKK